MSSTLEIRSAVAGDLDAIARLVGTANAQAEQRCLMCPETPEDVRRDMTEYGDQPQDHFVLAFRENNLVGAASCDWNEEQGRGWILGPFTAAGEWEAVSTPLFQALLDLVPGAIKRLDTYTDLPNTRAMDLYLAHEFKEFRRAQVYTAFAKGFAGKKTDLPQVLAAPLEGQFLALHAACFPEPPDPGPDLLARRDADHPIFAAARGETLGGYLAAKINAAPVEGFVDYLAVDEAERGRGVGSRLLQGALGWFFNERNMPQVSLVVHDTNRSARSIYERAGFCLMHTGVATQRFF